jgi:LuxR family transcriptional regulator, maltose regulon positive regulatory protein
MTDGNHIFSGLKVLDLASFVAGPTATTIPTDDLVFAICGDDLRSALRALIVANEYLKRRLTEACSAPSDGEQALSLADTHQTFLDREFEIGALIRSLQNNAKRVGRLSELPSHGEDTVAGRDTYDTGREPGQTFAAVALLSPRERTILELIAQGQSNKEIARELGITPETVKSHVKNIFIKLEVDKRAKAVARAAAIIRNGKISTGN